jgi:UDP-N-acetylmuramoylalanine--D-glutamate ligase
MFSQQKKYGILGLARSGIAAAYKIKSLGGIALLSDMKPETEIANASSLKAGFECEFGVHSDRLLNCDEWIVSPGIPLSAPIIEKGRTHNIPMISELEFGYQIISRGTCLIAVTGSNGKSTTASLIAHIINQSGKKCLLAGNIGDAFCSFPIEKPVYDFVVLEVSSFQLDLIDTFKPNIALLLNITPDHLNRYCTFQDYALSKFNIFRNQTANDQAILNMDDIVIEGLESLVHSKRLYFTLESVNKLRHIPNIWLNDSCIENNNGTCSFPIHNLPIKGPHNRANAMAAILACEAAGISPDKIARGLSSFKSLNHRMQLVQTINGISFYNDSKATNTDSVRYALLSFEQPIRIIMGGSDKGEDFSVLTELLLHHAKKIYITGDTSDKMREAWSGKIPISVIDNFDDCIRVAYEESMPGDNIVLSPACASFDKFRNFEHRGDTFINIVNTIAKENEKSQ